MRPDSLTISSTGFNATKIWEKFSSDNSRRYENKSPLNPAFRGAKRGPVFDVALNFRHVNLFLGRQSVIKALKFGALATALIASAAYASGNCVVDDLSMYFTGKTQVVSGTLLKEYRCARGHVAWGR